MFPTRDSLFWFIVGRDDMSNGSQQQVGEREKETNDGLWGLEWIPPILGAWPVVE